MASIVQKIFLETDLDNLKKLQQLLHKVTDEKINQAIADVQNWLGQDVTTDVRQPYENIKQVTESAIAFVTDIYQQIEDSWEKNVTEKLSAESGTRRSKKPTKASAELGDIKLLTVQVKEMEKKMTSLTARQDLTESTVDTKFKDIDDRFKEMTTSMQSVVQKHTTKFEDVERKFYNLQETQQRMKATVQKLSSELTVLGKKSDSLNFGFTATIPSWYQPVKGRTVTGYEKVRGNKLLSFSPDTGIFAAPVKGVYAVSVRQWQVGSGKIGMHVKKASQSGTGTAAATARGRTEEWICETWTRGNGDLDFCLELTGMEVGDTLRVETYTVTEDASLWHYSSFSVFLISS